MTTGLYDTKIQGLKEQKATARKLREQAMSEMPQGQMVSGWYVAPSITQNLASALRQGMAAYDEGKAGREADALEKRKEAETNAVMSQLYSNYQPPQQAEQSGLLDKISNFVTGEKPQEQPIQTPADLQANPNLDQNGRLAAMLRGSMVNPEAFAPMLGLEQHKMTMEQQKELKQAQLAQQKAQLEQQASYQQQGLDLRREQMQNQQAIQQQMLDLRRDAAANRPQGRNDWEMIKGADGMPTGRYNTATGQFEALQGIIPQNPANVGKDVPINQLSAQTENFNTLNKINRAIETVKSNPNAFGMKNYLPLTQYTDEQGIGPRSDVAELSAAKIHDLSGAAVSPTEMPRFSPFIPAASDRPQKVLSNLERMKENLLNMEEERNNMYSDGWKKQLQPLDRFKAMPQQKEINPNDELEALRQKHGGK
jgi:hypothetical protein